MGGNASPDAGGGNNGKSDLDRVGLFREMGYISLKDPYKGKDLDRPFCQDRRKGKQFQSAGSKTGKTQDVYFDPKYSRVFEGECYTEPLQRDRKNRKERLKNNLGPPFKPSSDLGRRSGMGTLSAAFTDKNPAMSPLKKPNRKEKPLGKNFVTKPGRKGTGYGYVDVTIGKTYDYQSTKYDVKKIELQQEHQMHKKKMIGKPFVSHHHPQALFDSNIYKGDEGEKGPDTDDKPKALVPVPFRPSHPAKSGAQGCLNPYPKQEGAQKPEGSKEQLKEATKIFKPPGGPKTMVSKSIALLNVPISRSSYVKSGI